MPSYYRMVDLWLYGYNYWLEPANHRPCNDGKHWQISILIPVNLKNCCCEEFGIHQNDRSDVNVPCMKTKNNRSDNSRSDNKQQTTTNKVAGWYGAVACTTFLFFVILSSGTWNVVFVVLLKSPDVDAHVFRVAGPWLQEENWRFAIGKRWFHNWKSSKKH